MIVGYIAHPLSAPTREGIEANRANAARWAAWFALSGISPSCSWIVMTGVLEETPHNRELGLACDIAQVERADGVFLVGGRISSGMAVEADHARGRIIPVVDLTALGWDPPAMLYNEAAFRGLLQAAALQQREAAAQRNEEPTLRDGEPFIGRMTGPDRGQIDG